MLQLFSPFFSANQQQQSGIFLVGDQTSLSKSIGKDHKSFLIMAPKWELFCIQNKKIKKHVPKLKSYSINQVKGVIILIEDILLSLYMVLV